MRNISTRPAAPTSTGCTTAFHWCTLCARAHKGGDDEKRASRRSGTSIHAPGLVPLGAVVWPARSSSDSERPMTDSATGRRALVCVVDDDPSMREALPDL